MEKQHGHDSISPSPLPPPPAACPNPCAPSAPSPGPSLTWRPLGRSLAPSRAPALNALQPQRRPGPGVIADRPPRTAAQSVTAAGQEGRGKEGPWAGARLSRRWPPCGSTPGPPQLCAPSTRPRRRLQSPTHHEGAAAHTHAPGVSAPGRREHREHRTPRTGAARRSPEAAAPQPPKTRGPQKSTRTALGRLSPAAAAAAPPLVWDFLRWAGSQRHSRPAATAISQGGGAPINREAMCPGLNARGRSAPGQSILPRAVRAHPLVVVPSLLSSLLSESPSSSELAVPVPADASA